MCPDGAGNKPSASTLLSQIYTWCLKYHLANNDFWYLCIYPTPIHNMSNLTKSCDISQHFKCSYLFCLFKWNASETNTEAAMEYQKHSIESVTEEVILLLINNQRGFSKAAQFTQSFTIICPQSCNLSHLLPAPCWASAALADCISSRLPLVTISQEVCRHPYLPLKDPHHEFSIT